MFKVVDVTGDLNKPRPQITTDHSEIKRLYLEITSHCNLDCAMCTRKNWQHEGIGHMDLALVDQLIAELPEHPELETVFLGGIGEPLTHPQLITIIERLKAAGKRVEMITNGTMLDYEMSKRLISSGLDMLWVSVDGAFSPCYEDIRQGATAGTVYQNLESFCQAKIDLGIFDVHIYDLNEYVARESLQLGLAFVAMKRNISELPLLIDEARKFGVREIKVTHVIPYTEEMVDEALYVQTIRYNLGQEKNPFSMHIDLPVMDWNEESKEALAAIYNKNLTCSHMDELYYRKENYCPFIEKGYVFVRWDGEVCPCMALLHDSKVYLNDVERHLKYKTFGSVKGSSLRAVWHGDEYADFRAKVKRWEFSPCVHCGNCEFLEDNEEDCMGNGFPTCGGCLWAQGLVQCP